MTTLYRLNASDGALLYVGVTDDIERRLAQHRRLKPWWTLVASVEAESFSARADALAAERRAITDESPRYNVRGAFIPWPGSGFEDREGYREAFADYLAARLVGSEPLRGEDVYAGWRECAYEAGLRPAAFTRRQLFNCARAMGWQVTRDAWTGVTLHP